jgi:hypothetical protein
LNAMALSAVLSLLFPLASESRSLSHFSASPPPANPPCPVFSWAISNFSVTYSDDTPHTPGNASFTVTNTFTNQSQFLACSLPFNYDCSMNDTLDSQDSKIDLLVDIEGVYVTINETWPCNKGTNATERWVLLHGLFLEDPMLG